MNQQSHDNNDNLYHFLQGKSQISKDMELKIYVLLVRAPKPRANFFWICSLVDKLLTCIRYLRKKV